MLGVGVRRIVNDDLIAEASLREEGMVVCWGSNENGEVDGRNWDVALISPSRYARFAAYQLARLM